MNSRFPDRLSPDGRARRWPDQYNAWASQDPRVTSTVAFRAWTAELRTVLVAHCWAIGLLHGSTPDLAPAAISAAWDPSVLLRRGPQSSPRGWTEVDATTEIAKYVERARTEDTYSMNLAYQPIMMMIFSQLAYGVDQLQARGIFPRKGESDVCDLLKHVRNAMAHGFYFSFDSRKVIPRPLTVGGLTLSFEHNGRSIDRVIGPGDLLDILDGVDVLADVLDSGVSTSADGA